MSMPSWLFDQRLSYQKGTARPMLFTLGWLACTLAFGAGPVAAEITSSGSRVGGGVASSATTSLEGDVRARCWQQGREILSEADFATAAIPPALREQAISLRGRSRTVVLLPFADSFCLLTVSP
jgi:uncharacterized protein (DUF1501 family)